MPIRSVGLAANQSMSRWTSWCWVMPERAGLMGGEA